MSDWIASDVQRLAREVARELVEAVHTRTGLEALLAPIDEAVRDGWGGISVTGHYGERVVVYQLQRRLVDLIEAARENETRRARPIALRVV